MTKSPEKQKNTIYPRIGKTFLSLPRYPDADLSAPCFYGLESHPPGLTIKPLFFLVLIMEIVD